ncbi:unnamed protein product [Victoria cruziana]
MAGNDKELPLFDGNNYVIWSVRMRAYFMSHGLWDLVVNGYDGGDNWKEGSKGVETKEMGMKDGKALSIILEAIPESVIPCLEDAMTSKEAWTILKQKYRPDKKEDVTEKSVSQPSDNQNSEEIGGSTEAAEEVESSPASDYRVFLSFRGEDTRDAFTSHLYDDLIASGISTFIDSEKLERGERIDKLFEYIERSKIIVVIFSEGYAESRWRLQEVARSVECKKQIIPVFFGVQPSDVRKQSGPFKSAFRKHDQEQNQEDVRKWREALEEVGNLSGFTLKDGKEAELRREIVKSLSTKVSRNMVEVAKHPIGLDSRVEDVKKIIGKCGHQIQVIGIHGMGGLGKTTIAKAVYNDLAKEFDGAVCFLSNIREKSESPNGLVDLQKQLISEVLKEKNVSLSDVAKGKILIKKKLTKKRVLLVLDDVDSVEQLDVLAGERDWFDWGSVIIITTRDKDVLLNHKVKEEEIYKPEELIEAESLELFILHAFDGEQPQGEYVHLANQIVAAAGGLPLTIKVLGSLLYSKKDVQKWEDILEKVKSFPPDQVQQKLKISYESLSNYQRKIFLDISHFFVGRGRLNATYMWEGLGWHPKTAIQVLIERSLITINDESGEFEMHDEIRDMGRELVGGESSEAPEKHTRLRESDSLDLLRPGIVGTKDIEAIQVMGGWNDPMLVDIGSFADMSRLRMLQLENVTWKGEYERFPRNIRWLQWSPQDLDCLPSCLHLDNMVVLHLSCSSIVRLWDGQKVFHQLKVLHLTFCSGLVVCPDFANMSHLEILNLEYCHSMSELHPSIRHLKSLIELCLAHCKSLEELPKEIYELTSLQKLDLTDCGKITAFPRQSGDSRRSSSEQHVLGKLQVLLFDYCRNLTRCPDLMKMPNLERLSFKDCEKMNEIDPSIGHLKRMIRLNLNGCSSLKELPQKIGQLTSLKEIDLSACSGISSLPESIVSLDQLETLSISDCELLKSLPPLPPSLIRLHAGDCCQLESVGDISNIKGLQELDLRWCERLLDVAGIEHLKLLELLNLAYCRSLCDSIVGRIKDLDKLKRLDFYGCESLTKSPHFTSNMTELRVLDFTSNMAELDSSIQHLKALTCLYLNNCKSLKELPEEVCLLTSLEYLYLRSCSSLREVPESICLLLHLELLNIRGCTSLATLPNSLGNLKSLTELSAWGCTSLASLPNSLGNLNSLRHLDLSWTAIEQLPDSIIQLDRLDILSVGNCDNLQFLPPLPPSLTWLDASGCGKLLDILGIEQLTGLEGLHLVGCVRLEDSLLERVESIFLNNEDLKRFSIPGRLIEGGSSYPQSLSFPLPKYLKDIVLYLYVDESSLNSIKTEMENRSEQGEESMGSVVRLAFSIDDLQFSFSNSLVCDYYCYSIPTATFRYEEVMKR